MKVRTKKTIDIATAPDEAGSIRRKVPVVFRRGAYAVVDGAFRNGDPAYSVTHAPTGMRVVLTKSERAAKWACRHAADYMPAAIDAVGFAQDPRTAGISATDLRTAAEVKARIVAEVEKREK